MIDFEAEGLLEGLEEEDRAERLTLLEELHEAGVPIERLREAAAEDRLAFVPVEHELAGEGVYTEAELVERAGVDGEALRRYWRAIGFTLAEPDARVFGERDVEAAQRAGRFRDAGIPEEEILDAARVMGEAMARVAEVLRRLTADAFVEEGDTERDLGLRYAQVARLLVPELGPMLEYMLHMHLVDQIRNDVITRAEFLAGHATPGSRVVSVAFADLVGFTRLGTKVETAELGAVAGELARLASEVAKNPVRLVKTLGDGVMFVSTNPDALVDAILQLVEATGDLGEEYPGIRAGIATGPALNRGGDWYGHTVNLASRVCGVARPGSVLATRDARSATREERDWSFIGERKLKGIKEPAKLFRVRAAAGS